MCRYSPRAQKGTQASAHLRARSSMQTGIKPLTTYNKQHPQVRVQRRRRHTNTNQTLQTFKILSDATSLPRSSCPYTCCFRCWLVSSAASSITMKACRRKYYDPVCETVSATRVFVHRLLTAAVTPACQLQVSLQVLDLNSTRMLVPCCTLCAPDTVVSGETKKIRPL